MPPRAADAPRSPDLPAELPAATDDPHGWSGAAVAGTSLPDLEASGLSVLGARLARVELAGARLPSLRLVDVELSACDLAGVQARGAALAWEDLLELLPALAGALGIRVLDADDDG